MAHIDMETEIEHYWLEWYKFQCCSLQVLDFEREQLLRVKDIQAREADALAKVKEAKNGKAAYIVKVGMMLPVSNISQNWEVDTNCGEQETKHDEFDKGKKNRSAVLF